MPPKTEKPSADYSATLNLPQTEFPMRGDLPKREPGILEFWAKINLYRKMRTHQDSRPNSQGCFLLHDGPPYANGHTHIGHALNKILKDMTVKSRSLMGFASPYIPGWDCRGLPIETALLKEMKISKRGIKDIPAFRRSASEFAERFIAIQKKEFMRLGCVGDWETPYKTMSREYEAKVLEAFRRLYAKDYIYRGLKPVYWCVTCETALAEAEIEYKDKTSPSIYAAFPILKSAIKELAGAEAMIWTTTPWTLPANRAVALNPDLKYVLISKGNRKFIVAETRAEFIKKLIGADGASASAWSGAELTGTHNSPNNAQHQYKLPYKTSAEMPEVPGPLIRTDYVTAEDGTGLVHTAPGHGPDDYQTGITFGLDIYSPVDASGCYNDQAPEFLRNLKVFPEGNEAVIADLEKRGLLLARENIQHSYPHCWRCKNPVIFRATEQWFMKIAPAPNGRSKLADAINTVNWMPEASKSRISSMVENRPDWCLSRQRVWGTLIPVLYCAKCSTPINDERVFRAIEDAVRREGDAFWFENPGSELAAGSRGFLPHDLRCPDAFCGGRTFRRETDVLDVWMDSGASWFAVLGRNAEKPQDAPVADLYLEGSDQHRGWFQSSLVLSAALAGRAPYKSVLTHGFVLDERGRAMHKSAGNVVSPQDVIDKMGADVLRLWVAFADYGDDVRISDKLLEVPSEAYRKFRNTARYLLGNTFDFQPAKDAVAFENLPELEKYVLIRLIALQKEIQEDYQNFRFRAAARKLIDFCAFDLSAFYLDIVKDRLYTFPATHPARRAAQTVMAECLTRLLLLAAPILSFTAEEAWQSGPKAWNQGDSVFLADLPLETRDGGTASTNFTIQDRWKKIRAARAAVQKILEEARTAKKIGSSLQAAVALSGGDAALLNAEAWSEILLVSQVSLHGGAGELQIVVSTIPTLKCARCWRYPKDVGAFPEHPELCGRCHEHLKTTAIA
ncbi:MAG: isoleucine--tRNA ligase [Elusimicrobiota bacterium]